MLENIRRKKRRYSWNKRRGTNVLNDAWFMIDNLERERADIAGTIFMVDIEYILQCIVRCCHNRSLQSPKKKFIPCMRMPVYRSLLTLLSDIFFQASMAFFVTFSEWFFKLFFFVIHCRSMPKKCESICSARLKWQFNANDGKICIRFRFFFPMKWTTATKKSQKKNRIICSKNVKYGRHSFNGNFFDVQW